MKKEDKDKIFKDRRCPECDYDGLLFYNPFFEKGNLHQEIECEKCGHYVIWFVDYDSIEI